MNTDSQASNAAAPALHAPWRVLHEFGFTVGGAERVSAILARDVTQSNPLLAIGGDPNLFAQLGVGEVGVLYPRIFTPRRYREAGLLLPLLSSLRRPLAGNVLVSSYAFAHHIPVEGKKVVYCHTPLRQVWSGADLYSNHLSKISAAALRAPVSMLRQLDVRAATSAASYVANSKAVAERIERFYGFRAEAVIPPPYDERFTPNVGERGEHYLWVGRIVEPYKRLEPVLEAFRESPYRRLTVVGEGRDAARLRMLAPDNVRFVGALDTEGLALAYSEARAVIFPSEDDFGLVPVEAMACGTPVLALGRGGALETVIADETGLFFDSPTPAAIMRVLDRFEAETWDSGKIATYASETFSHDVFVRRMRDALNEAAR